MTVVVGYRADKVGLSGLYLAVGIARTLQTSLTVATIVPRGWPAPSLARVDAEYQYWAENLAESSANEARGYLMSLAEDLEVHYCHRAHRSVSRGLAEVVEESGAEILVLGSLPSSGRVHMVVGSTTDSLLHSSAVPVAISSPGYQSRTGRLTRLTCAYAPVPQSVDVVRRCAAYAERMQIPLRVLTFAVRGRTMYPPDVGLDAEDSILETWAAQAREALQSLKIDGVIGNDVVLKVITGHTWLEALHRADWVDGEILTLGTSPGGDIRRVFLGVRSGQIIRHSPLPVLVLPG
ncbi:MULTISPECIES: universal stress protein [Mycobacterium]|uniref:Universal stress protein n=1 Tax=Mycobacterium gordonae TaxID=1778 RepID=A0A1A6BNN8_MYCGO|nr:MULTISPECIES: universal stress protein [Mycobacterium]MBI2700567.1 universal stress protein [Mycobacterium sp.]MBX9979329.1 universal stress protein [Mycobacterium gordonae]MCQ4362403.1 universal stress protein [Mycobacterium gordonae]MCV7009325.1 universal stress protein [Mycobacterium gordonae]OBS03911.1 universal stress protein [Mycobacterium gordonae]